MEMSNANNRKRRVAKNGWIGSAEKPWVVKKKGMKKGGDAIIVLKKYTIYYPEEQFTPVYNSHVIFIVSPSANV